MIKQPLVSVLMTAYNREKYIAEAIESVLASSYTNFELIIVDDSSKDKTVEIAKSFEKIDTRIKVYINEKNIGDYANRNQAACYANGKYIKYLDSDDVIYKYSLNIMVEAMERFPDASYAFTNFPNQDDNAPFPIVFSPKQAYMEHFFKDGFFYSGPGGTIIRKSIFLKEGGFSGIRMVGDYELWLKLGAKYPVIKIQPNLVWWRKHEGQEYVVGNSSNMYKKLNYKILLSALEYTHCPLPIELRNTAIYKIKKGQSRMILKMLLKGDFNSAKELFHVSNLNFFDLITALKK